MPNSEPPPEQPPAVLFETKPTVTGYRLKGLAFRTPGGGIAVQLFRRTLLAGSNGEHEQTWYIVSSLAVYPPIGIPETLHTYTSWLNSYDASLKDELGPLQEALAELHESARPADAPQGSMVN